MLQRLKRADRHAELLHKADISTDTVDLAQRAHLDTLGAAVLAAILRSSPDADERDLVVDVERGGHLDTITISETSVGGLGIVESLERNYAGDPRRFWQLTRAGLGPTEYEATGRSLHLLLQEAVNHPQDVLAMGMRDFRNAVSVQGAESAVARITHSWTNLQGPPRHSAQVALTTRFLRPGSSTSSDEQVLAVVEAWQQLEHVLGVEVDSRAIAYAAAKGTLTSQTISLNADQLFSLFWPRGSEARSRPLMHYNPYAPSPIIDRLLVTTAHEQGITRIDVTDVSWPQKFRERLGIDGAVELIAPSSGRVQLARAVRLVPTLPIDQDVLRLYGRLRSFSHDGDTIAARIELAEAIQ